MTGHILQLYDDAVTLLLVSDQAEPDAIRTIPLSAVYRMERGTEYERSRTLPQEILEPYLQAFSAAEENPYAVHCRYGLSSGKQLWFCFSHDPDSDEVSSRWNSVISCSPEWLVLGLDDGGTEYLKLSAITRLTTDLL